MIIIINGRGARLDREYELINRLNKACSLQYELRFSEDDFPEGATILDFPFSKNAPSDKLAFDWLVKGRGYSKFTLLSVPNPEHSEAKFTKREAKKAFFQCMIKAPHIKPDARLDVYGTSKGRKV
jgi:hypothetical protein